ncbi:DUF4232 domain-containing protein [Streptomyces sp. NPDC048442]|uniref:DUF4232 domain-containing protein n=1 Tax=Streptomyces sp. NPDC048442 TaxID=3154823 RepID=UPI003445F154
MGVRTSTKGAAAVLFGALTLTGCDGFLVPAGEGEPRAAQSSAAPSPTPSPTSARLAPDRPAPAPGGGATYSPPAPQDCPAGVRVDMGPVQAALMHRLATLTLTNCGKTPYKLSGRPSVKAYASDGTALDIEVNVREEGKKEDAVVMLPPGGVAYSRLDWMPYDGVEKAQALEIAAGPGHDVRSFPLAEDVRMVDAFDVTPWALTRPR